jgi:hypothetical protein
MERFWMLGGLLGLMLLLPGCGDVGGSGQCGGVESSGTCVQIQSIIPTYLGENTRNVDIFQNVCDATTIPLTMEDFEDHAADITINNTFLPGVDESLSMPVTLQNYSISYSVNACASSADCPALDTFTVSPGETITIPANSSVKATFPLVPLQKKIEFNTKLLASGGVISFPSYTAHYIITGTDFFNHPISVEGYTEFTMGAYDHC